MIAQLLYFLAPFSMNPRGVIRAPPSGKCAGSFALCLVCYSLASAFVHIGPTHFLAIRYARVLPGY